MKSPQILFPWLQPFLILFIFFLYVLSDSACFSILLHISIFLSSLCCIQCNFFISNLQFLILSLVLSNLVLNLSIEIMVFVIYFLFLNVLSNSVPNLLSTRYIYGCWLMLLTHFTGFFKHIKHSFYGYIIILISKIFMSRVLFLCFCSWCLSPHEFCDSLCLIPHLMEFCLW